MQERIDILDDTGAPTGRSKAKSAVHRDGDWHLAAHLWIVTPDGRLLLQRRAEVKESWPGMWDISVAGHVSAGESAIEAVLREAREELGLTFSPDELRHLGRLRYHAVVNDGAFIENEYHEVYLATRDVDLDTLTLDPEEVAEARLVRPEELEQYEVVPHPEEYALLFDAIGWRRVDR
jgi:isopentenyl-diphosphate delta-isomerase type 1